MNAYKKINDIKKIPLQSWVPKPGVCISMDLLQVYSTDPREKEEENEKKRKEWKEETVEEDKSSISGARKENPPLVARNGTHWMILKIELN